MDYGVGLFLRPGTWQRATEPSTGADWLLTTSGDAIALSVITRKEMVDREQAFAKQSAGRWNGALASQPSLETAEVDPEKLYTIAFPHRSPIDLHRDS